MAEEAGQQRYCRNCGAELRSGMSFCVSCGTPVSPVVGGTGPSSGPDGPGRLGSFFDGLRRSFRQSADGLGGTFSGFDTDGIRGLWRRASGWLRDLPVVPKLILVGLTVLVVLVLLSPVAMIVAAVLFGVSIIALMIRMAQKGSLKNWGIVAVASVVLMFVFGGVSGALYGIGFTGDAAGAPDRPQTPEEKIESSLRSVYGGQLRNVDVEGSRSVGYIVDADFDARCSDCSDAQFVRAVENDMEDGYGALYTSSMSPGITEASLTAYHVMVSNTDGSESDEVIFSTTLPRTEAADLNWENSSYIDFATVWEVNEVHENYDPLWTSGPAFDTGYDY